MIHGSDDDIVPIEFGRKVFELAAEPKHFHEASGSGHFTPWVTEGGTFEEMLCQFFGRAIEGR